MSKPIAVELKNQRGLHARASAKLVKCAETYNAEITVTCNGRSATACSIMDLMMLGGLRGSHVELDGKGPERDKAIEAIRILIEDKFGEEK